MTLDIIRLLWNNLPMMDESEQPRNPQKYRDKRTQRFANGERVREFQEVATWHATQSIQASF